MHTLTVMDRRKNDKNLFELMLSEPEFDVLSGEDVELLDKIMLVDTYTSGHRFKSADNIYLILDGEVAVIHKKMEGGLRFERVHLGEFFDLFTLIDKRRRSTKCIAIGSVRAASLPRVAFELLFRANLPLSHHFRYIITNQIMRHTPVPARSIGAN